MVNYCENCGSEIEDNSIYCRNCGMKVNGDSDDNKSSIKRNRNPFDLYKLDMFGGERIIRRSDNHFGCLILPGFVLLIGFIYSCWVSFNSYYGFFYHYWDYLYFLVVGIILNPFLFIGLIWFAIRFISCYNADLILTNKRIFGKCGLIKTTKIQCQLNKVDSVSFSNGILGKILGYGTVKVTTTSSKFKFRFIRDGQSLCNDIFNQVAIDSGESIQK